MKTKSEVFWKKLRKPGSRNRDTGRWPFRAMAYGAMAVMMTFTGRWVLAQSIPQPILAITSTSSNSMVITITNGVSLATYDIWTTPVLANQDYPWMVAAVGTTNQTNFTVEIGPYPVGFFQAVVDTNGIPLWEAADPNNPSAGILSVFIDSPTNGALLQ
jgi:hypothetical protein